MSTRGRDQSKRKKRGPPNEQTLQRRKLASIEKHKRARALGVERLQVRNIYTYALVIIVTIAVCRRLRSSRALQGLQIPLWLYPSQEPHLLWTLKQQQIQYSYLQILQILLRRLQRPNGEMHLLWALDQQQIQWSHLQRLQILQILRRSSGETHLLWALDQQWVQ